VRLQDPPADLACPALASAAYSVELVVDAAEAVVVAAAAADLTCVATGDCSLQRCLAVRLPSKKKSV